ncbi:MAG TPA: FemAB family XrtA/PEP-CTERM system-associated protein [Phycisphaerae bacterium]|nr:FemAB family XrtA/PEP-CTERM system-associated protein [Phycisphaerae bacterium]
MGISIQQLDETLESAWSTFAQRSGEASFYHSLAWRDAVSAAFGHEAYYLIALRDGQPAGILPSFLIRSSLAGPMLVSVPYAVYGGIAADDREVSERLFEAAKDLAEATGAGYVDLRSRRAALPTLPIIDKYVTFIKELPPTPEQVLGSLPRKARAAARTAREKFALSVEFDDKLLPAVWQLYSRSMRRLASLNYPLKFFKQLVQRSAGMHLVQIVRYRERPVGGLVSFVWRDTVLPYFSGCDERYNFAGVNNYLYLTLMERAAGMGLRKFDFGRTRKDNDGCVRFKCHQGFSPQPLEYQAYVPANGHDPGLSPDRARYRLAGAVWRRLPLAVTRPLGAWLAGSIPG